MNGTPYKKTANEPQVDPVVRKSFAFVPSAGMRLAPEVLVLELMREVFFERHYGNQIGTRYLDPDEPDAEGRHRYTIEERAVLHAMGGRRKKSKNASDQRFFAPAYPQLAKGGWLRKSSDRVINNFLFSGPVAQHLWSRGPDAVQGKRDQEELVETTLHALVGNNSCLGKDPDGKELLAVALGSSSFEAGDGFDALGERPRRNLLDKTGSYQETDAERTGRDPVMRGLDDELARRITLDFRAICHLESGLPRMQWIHLLMTFLRFALPTWLLAQMQVTRLLHAWVLDAADHGAVADTNMVKRALAGRNRGLLHPTLTPTRELFEHTERYMKCRVELNILLHWLRETRGSQVNGKALALEGGASGVLGIEELLLLARDAAADIRGTGRFMEVAEGLGVKTFLAREGEQFSAWRNPLMKGQGKNIDEFFRVLYRAELGDEAGGYLLTPEGRGAKRGFRVFPGQLLLKTVTYLAAQEKRTDREHGGAGKLALQDVEDHFGQYGVDFSTAADARPLLMKELQAMGLLTGSPDAGCSVAVACPY